MPTSKMKTLRGRHGLRECSEWHNRAPKLVRDIPLLPYQLGEATGGTYLYLKPSSLASGLRPSESTSLKLFLCLKGGKIAAILFPVLC